MNNRDKFILVGFIVVFIVYNIIGYVFDVDVLRFVTIGRQSFGMSFVGIIAPLISAYLIYYTLKFLKLV